MKPYREHDYEMWCRRRAEARGGAHDGPLYWLIYRSDRDLFEEEWAATLRHVRGPAELTEAFGGSVA